ncbi:Sialin [Chionoecetes opilio]|uniref:Sialin n=1 Tax=Chionoecetes opilio TaxID=41210 RepID=A0A8J5CQ86_CHIOP|nr:Sialin [Chionoecetes opilio]
MKEQEQSLDGAAVKARQSSAAASIAVVGDEGALVGASSLALLEPHHDRPRNCWGARHTLAFLGFLGFAAVYAMRVNLSVAIVCMVKSKNASDSENNTVSDTCPPPSSEDTASNDEEIGEFEWSETTQGLILGSFFYGYLVTNIPGGRAAEYFGGKRVLGFGILLTAVFTVLSPLCARLSTGLFIAVRVLEGLFEGVTFPAMNILLATWIPPMERAKFSSLVFAGAQFGTVVTLPVSGWLCESGFLGGWPAVFYVFGGIGILWSIAWFALAFDHPDTHPRISQEEKKYILQHCAARKAQPEAIPWKSLATSVPLWCVAVVHLGQNWGFYTLLTELPTYLKNIQHFDMKSNGLVSALPYLVMWIFSLVYSNIVDRLLVARKLSLSTVRKMSMIIGIYGPMLGLVAMCFVNCDKTLAIVVLCVAVGLNGAVYSGYMCSHQDLAPNLAGTLMGFTNTVATIPGFVTPVVTGIITETQTLSSWRTVFIISAGVYLVTNIGYLLFVPATVQPWNNQTSPPKEGK